tara:strand:- start:113 stop:601 length:489 start_codon:yes stop_codon:yes gene_type:complete
MSDTGKKKRKSRKTKEEKMLEKVAKEQKEEQERSLKETQDENEENESENNQQRQQVPFQATPEQQQLMQNPDINQKMMDMDVRIKYGFIKTLHNNLISINRRFNWDPAELMAIGMVFRDLQSIELNVFNTVMQNEENAQEEVEEEDEEEENEDPEEETEEIN